MTMPEDDRTKELVSQHVKSAFGFKDPGMEVRWCPSCHALVASDRVLCMVCRKAQLKPVALIEVDGRVRAFKVEGSS